MSPFFAWLSEKFV